MQNVAELKGIKNIPDLAAYLGYSSAEKLYRLKRSPDAKPSVDILEDLTNKFEDLDLRWLISGKGEPLVDNTPADNHMVTEQRMTYKVRTPNRSTGGNLAISGLSDPPTDPQKQILIPQYITVDREGKENILYVTTRAAAGYLNGYADPEYLGKLKSFTLPWLNDGTYRMFEVSGDSMAPTLENKWRVIGKLLMSIDDIREDYVHVIVTKTQGVVIKRLLNRVNKYGYIIAKSDAVDNRHLYPNIEIPADEVLEIWEGQMFFGNSFRHPKDMYYRIQHLEADLTEVMRLLRQQSILPEQ